MPDADAGQPAGGFLDEESSEPCGFGETMAMVRGRFPTIRDMLNVRAMPGTNRNARKLIDCALHYMCYLHLGRPPRLRRRVLASWAALCDDFGG
tara:strand:+ start:24 stop:305 length:282 start_codon:yes stop_codon:yes gene_type:complete